MDNYNTIISSLVYYLPLTCHETSWNWKFWLNFSYIDDLNRFLMKRPINSTRYELVQHWEFNPDRGNKFWTANLKKYFVCYFDWVSYLYFQLFASFAILKHHFYALVAKVFIIAERNTCFDIGKMITSVIALSHV